MRILRIRLKNLNSLLGEWDVDLTHPAYSGDGIFAITGPTGAGKSTLLDAICLALYGRTPRLAKVTKGANEIMSRQAGECFAEVTFDTPGGRFRCHWSQHRSRRKAGGELQSPRHEIADAETDAILESSLRGVADQVESVTGMDFERFTRSMLLAQGGFAAFLQAAPDKRSPLLEQITGTAIYSQISVRVHERRGDERRALETLQAGLGGLVLLSAEDEALLASDLDEKHRRDASLTDDIAAHQASIAWIEDIARLEQNLQALAAAEATLDARLAAFAPEQARLDGAVRALELSADHAALSTRRQALQRDAEALATIQPALPLRCDEAARAERDLQAARQALAGCIAQQQAAQPTLRSVREMDLRIADKAAPIAALELALAEQAQALAVLQARQRADLDALAATAAAARQRDATRAATQADAALVEQLAGLRERFDGLSRRHAALDALVQQVAQAENQARSAFQDAIAQAAALDRHRQALAACRDALDAGQAERLRLLAGLEMGEWRHRQADLNEQAAWLAQAAQALQAATLDSEAANAFAAQRIALAAERTRLAEQRLLQLDRQRALETEGELLQTQLALLLRVEALEDARHHLQDGQACPLCGALEHPFAEAPLPAPDRTRERLETSKAALRHATQALLDSRVLDAGLAKDEERAEAEQRRLAAAVDAARARIVQACSALPQDGGLVADDPALAQKLADGQAALAVRQRATAATLQAAEAQDAALARSRAALDQARDAAAQADRETQSARHRSDSAAQTLERLRSDEAELRQQQAQAVAELCRQIQGFGAEAFELDGLAAALDHLAARRDQWLERQRESAELARRHAELEAGTTHQAAQLAQMQQAHDRQRAQRAGLQQERQALSQQRQALFGAGDVGDEEARLAAATDAARHAADAALARQQAENAARDGWIADIARLEQAVASGQEQLSAAQAAFDVRLQASGFGDEAAYRDACLPEPVRARLAQDAAGLAQERRELSNRLREQQALLAAQRQRQRSTSTLDALRQQLLGTTLEQRALQQEIGAIVQKLADNRQLKQRRQAQFEAIEAQQRECLRWDALHELIGSADGKRFRNFAQGLTFEMMVGHANRQLQKMSDRYLLVRDAGQPLELNVIDNYQAGETRSTKNLSGGESFIVSLALALGLSQMASRNVRVDSLFLDEGFGTLDEDTLEAALETLGSLQQEGKLIGVISHVAALKQRIATQIEITPLTGGRSRLSGPGCSAAKPSDGRAPIGRA